MSNQTKLILSLVAIVIAFVGIVQLLEYFFGAYVVFLGALCGIPFAFAWCKYDDYKYKKKLDKYHNQFKH
jgi:hypothetical protein